MQDRREFLVDLILTSHNITSFVFYKFQNVPFDGFRLPERRVVLICFGEMGRRREVAED